MKEKPHPNYNRKPFTPKKVNLLVFIYQNMMKDAALDKLWEFYFPLIKDIILFKIAKSYFDLDNYVEDILQESYVIFVTGVKEYAQDNYCFSSYIDEYMNIKIDSVIKRYEIFCKAS